MRTPNLLHVTRCSICKTDDALVTVPKLGDIKAYCENCLQHLTKPAALTNDDILRLLRLH